MNLNPYGVPIMSFLFHFNINLFRMHKKTDHIIIPIPLPVNLSKYCIKRNIMEIN